MAAFPPSCRTAKPSLPLDRFLLMGGMVHLGKTLEIKNQSSNIFSSTEKALQLAAEIKPLRLPGGNWNGGWAPAATLQPGCLMWDFRRVPESGICPGMKSKHNPTAGASLTPAGLPGVGQGAAHLHLRQQ